MSRYNEMYFTRTSDIILYTAVVRADSVYLQLYGKYPLEEDRNNENWISCLEEQIDFVILEHRNKQL